MMNNKIKAFVMLTLIATQYQNCSKIAVSDTSFSGKVEALENSPILPNQPNQGHEFIEDGVSQTGGVGFPVSALCSDGRSNDKNSNVVSSKSLELQLVKFNYMENENEEVAVCANSATDSIRADLKNKKISFPNCKLPDGEYLVKLLNENKKNLVYTNGPIRVREGKMKNINAIEILMDSNPDENEDLNSGVIPYAGSSCDEKKSPLYVDMRKDSSEFDILSAPEDGVMFDIAGENAKPQAHQKYQISWFEKGRFALLALPNEEGQVLGINELFGDNTKGPDGKFSENGFLSLAKYDLNGDGVISKEDAVFSKLRLWFDRDRNGVSQASELVSMKEAKIEAFDLKYDKNFYEVDQYGNEIKFKSVVKFKNGKLKPVFDLWFIIK